MFTAIKEHVTQGNRVTDAVLIGFGQKTEHYDKDKSASVYHATC